MVKTVEEQAKRLARSQALKRRTVTIYVPVDENIYFDGLSYRVRVTMDGKRTSKSFPRYSQAKKFRKTLRGF